MGFRARTSDARRPGGVLPLFSRGSSPILSRDPSSAAKPPETQGKRIRFSKRTMVEKNEEPTPRCLSCLLLEGGPSKGLV